MRAGRLRHRGKLLRPVTYKSPTGQDLQRWDLYGEVWMGIEPLSGKMRMQSEQIYADVTHRGVLRYHKQVAAGHRVTHRGRTFEVTSVIDRDERRREIELMMIETK